MFYFVCYLLACLAFIAGCIIGLIVLLYIFAFLVSGGKKTEVPMPETNPYIKRHLLLINHSNSGHTTGQPLNKSFSRSINEFDRQLYNYKKDG
jgi:hypothetical protein